MIEALNPSLDAVGVVAVCCSSSEGANAQKTLSRPRLQLTDFAHLALGFMVGVLPTGSMSAYVSRFRATANSSSRLPLPTRARLKSGGIVLDPPKLRGFDEERFYSVLDVAIDIQGELDFHANPILIQVMRNIVRFEVLMPGDGINMRDRYCELRWKAAEFLKSEGYLSEVTWIDSGNHRWEGRIRVKVANEPEFHRLLITLNEEEERRDPLIKTQHMPSAMARLEQLGDRFHRVALKLRSRHADRPPFEISDEYDVQDLFEALLHTRFEDIRPEEWAPSYGGRASRIDFLLKEEQIMVEMKMIREGLTDGRVGEELIIDTDRYKVHPDCNGLFCFVYDPEHRLKNPDSIESDLSRKTDGLTVRVQVRPKR